MSLVPERRTDKNGKTSTRWVKSDTGAGKTSRKSQVPKVDIKSAEEKAAVRRANKMKRIAKAIIDDTFFADAEEKQILIDECLTPLSDRTLDMIEAVIKEGKENTYYVDISLRDYREPRVQELISFMRSFHLDADATERDAILDQIRKHPHFAGVKDLSTLEEEDRHIAESLISVSCQAMVTFEAKDIGDNVRNFVIDNHERADDIVAFISARSTTDLSLLRAYLHGTHSGLRDGAL